MKILLVFIFFAVAVMVQAQDAFRVYPSRNPFWFNLYERELLKEKPIERVDTLHVWKWMNVVWMQGIYKYEGDTTKLIFTGWQKDNDQKGPLGEIWYPAYKYYDTVYVKPSVKGFEKWKSEKGYRIK